MLNNGLDLSEKLYSYYKKKFVFLIGLVNIMTSGRYL